MRDKVTDVIAAGMVTSPAWAPALSDFNEFLTTVALLCGIIWTIIQMRNYFKNKKDNHDPE